MKKEVLILSNHNYQTPSGAAYSRILCYARAICLENSYLVKLASFKHSNDITQLTNIEENIYYIGNLKNEKKSFFNKIINKYLYSFKSFLYIIKLSRKVSKETKIIVFSMRLFDDLLILLFFKKLKKCTVVVEKNELLSAIPSNNNDRFTYFMAKRNDEIARYYDGIIAISTTMEKWARKRNKKVIRIPILCEIREYLPRILQSEVFKIVYTGTISEQKDGVFSLIKAIEKLTELSTTVIKLEVYGEGAKKEIETITNYIKNKKLHNITLHGNIPHQQIFRKLIDGDLLVLPRPKTKQNDYGFSTKLAEYLSTGRAVLVTDVSDNKLYIKEGINGFVMMNNDIVELKNKLQLIVRNNKCLAGIGYNGFSTARQNFFYDRYSKKLIDFLF